MTVSLIPSTTELAPETQEALMIRGDLGRMTPAQKMAYYRAICDRVGLDWMTRPFDYLTLKTPEGEKTLLYARKDATEQLRKLHKVSLRASEPIVDPVRGVVVIKVTATLPDGRVDEDYGSSSIQNDRGVIRDPDESHKERWTEHPPLSGKAFENAVLRAVTKAKRRVTLSICGLGFLDESELDTMADKVVAPKLVSADTVIKIRAIADSNAIQLPGHLDRFGVTSVSELSEAQANDLLGLLEIQADVHRSL